MRLTFVPLSPFKYGNRIPTDEDVSRVSEDILDDSAILVEQGSREKDEVRRILSELVSPTTSELVSDLAFAECTHPEDFVVAEILHNDSIRPHQLVLTRDERRRIFRPDADISGPLEFGSPHRLAGPTGDDIEMALDFDRDESPFEELVFNSQVPQRNLVEPEYRQPETCEDEYEEEHFPVPAKRRRLGDFPPVVDSRFEPPQVSPESDRVRHSTSPPVIESTPPRRTEIPKESRSPWIPPAPQNPNVLPDTIQQPRDPIPPNIPDTGHHFVPPAMGRAIEPDPTRATGMRQGFAEFLALRGVHISAPLAAATETPVDNPQPTETLRILQPPLTEVPLDLIDKNTIQLPAADYLPVSRHQYLASLDLLQKHALCRRLSDDTAAIDIIERDFLGGVDLILDQDTAILFVPLSVVPSECEGLIAGISDISWRYTYMLVIFEAFLVSQAFADGEENRTASFALTEPILKSVRKLKRSLAIAEGVGTKTEDCLVSWAFAKNIEEAARLARVYGDMAESRDRTGGLLWQERWWLGEREAEDPPLFEPEVRPARLPQRLPLAHGTFRTKMILRWWQG